MAQASISRYIIRWTILAAAALLAFGVSVLGGSTAYAYNNSGSKPCVWQYQANTQLRPLYRADPHHPPGGSYATAYAQARSEWNRSDTPVLFRHDESQSSHKMGVRDLGQSGPLGNTSWTCLAWFHKRSATSAVLNSYHLDSESLTYKRSVATHELGHYIGVRHSSVSPAIMNITGDNNAIYQVYEDDECAVNSRYSHTNHPVTCN